MNEIKIPCPDNPNHEATLYVRGHEYAGIWECETCEVSDVCPHEYTHIDEEESLPTSPWDWVYKYRIAICDLCDCTVEDAEVGLIEQDCSL